MSETIKSIEEFISWTKQLEGEALVYRGLSDATWEVSASAYRRIEKSSQGTPPPPVFQNYIQTEKKKVTGQMKQKRAEEIATLLNDPERWHSHGRGISMDTLRNELQLKIEDFSEHESLADNIKKYFDLLMDYLNRHNIQSFVHTENYF